MDKYIERCDIAEARTTAQDLYDRLTCAGMRHELWPPSPGDPTNHPGFRLEEAFEVISDYIDGWETQAQKPRANGCAVCGKEQTAWSYCVISDGEHHEYESTPIVPLDRGKLALLPTVKTGGR